MAKTVVFDFDGVIHSYTSGWQGEDTILDPPVPGIREALKEIRDAGYEVVVVSTRCATIKGHGAIEAWLYDNGLREYIDKVCKEKPPAVAYIDDRAICFDGHPETLLKKIKNFQAWKDQGRDYEALLLESVVEQIVDTQPTLTPPNEPLTLEDAKKERYIWFTPLNDWAKVTSFGVLFFGSEELMSWETLCEEWGYRFKAYRRPPEEG